jgi:aspartate racemase
MKILGMIGGLGPESTIEYYENIIELYRVRWRDGSYPQFIINSVDLKKGIDFIAANDLTGMANYLLEEIG